MKKTLLCLPLLVFSIAAKAQDCSDLFISEYVEGGGNSKAIEFYNPTNASINLNNYRLVRYSNGSTTGTDSTDLVGTISSYSTFVIANGVGVTSGATGSSPACDPALQALAQQLDGAYPVPTFMNGDDALMLVKKNPYTVLDIFGKIGEQPATAWSDVAPYDGTIGEWWTKDHSLQRKASVKEGVKTNPTLFNVKLQWDSLPKDNWTNLNLHTCDCNTSSGIKENVQLVKLKVYPNPSNSSEIAFVSDNVINEVKIVNAIGQVVYTTTSHQKTVVLNQLHLAPGIYHAVVSTPVGTKSEKLIIQ